MALIALHHVQAVPGIKPLLIHIRCCLLVALGTGNILFLCTQFRMAFRLDISRPDKTRAQGGQQQYNDMTAYLFGIGLHLVPPGIVRQTVDDNRCIVTLSKQYLFHI